jgi:hypothetical protein
MEVLVGEESGDFEDEITLVVERGDYEIDPHQISGIARHYGELQERGRLPTGSC